MSNSRSVKYRRLALVEPDQEKAQLLYRLADEADRGVLFTSEWLSGRASALEEMNEVKPPA
jgi:hypothetical protein